MNNNSNFQIIGNKIYDPNGQEFIIKGANMFAWEGIENVHNYLNIWGFNTIRVPNYLLGSYEQPHPADNDYRTNHKIVDAYTSQGAVVMFNAHDLIGSYYEDENWEILRHYWRDMAQEFQDNPYVWFNLHNEPGNDVAQPEKWVNYHRELIEIIRAEGANNMIVIDGEAWGQDYHTQTIASSASEIMAGNENIVFSVHVYDQWNSNDLGAYFDLLEAQNIPFIVGEYGSETNDNSTLAATEQMFPLVREREIGRIVWNAKADDLNDLTTGEKGHAEHFDGTNTEILTELGQLVWQDLQRTEDLSQLPDYETTANDITFSEGVFEVDASGEIQFDFLFDGHWFDGELALFNLEGMENYVPGSVDFIQEAASRALSNSSQGYTLLQDSTEGARFGSSFDWEFAYNSGQYLGQKTFSLPEGTRFGLMLTQNNTLAEIATNPENIWQERKLPIFSIPEANPGTAEGQLVAVDDYDLFAFEDLRVDWERSDRDYNDIVFQLQGASGVVPDLDEWINPDRNWLETPIGAEILAINQDIVPEETSVIKGSHENDLLNGDAANNLIKGHKGDDFLDGNAGDDTLKGGDGNDTLFGNNDNDLLQGGKGDDFLHGDLGNDTLKGGKGNDSLWGDDGDDFLQGGKEDDLLNGDMGDDNLKGGEGNDSLWGDDGSDFLQGGRGNDLLHGDIGADTLRGGEDNDSLWGGDGNDFLQGGKKDDLLYGGLGADTLRGGESNDFLWGDDGDDLLQGRKGNDWLNGGLGNDILKGGEGNDVFVLANDNSIDTILDFEPGADKIELSDSLSFSDLVVTQGTDSHSKDILISLKDGDRLLAIIEKQNIDNITILDFI